MKAHINKKLEYFQVSEKTRLKAKLATVSQKQIM